MEAWLESFARANFVRGNDTAHDLKTPLNVAVLNLELLRMRLRNLLGSEDEKVWNYLSSIEAELRRLARIFDAFFLNASPPRNEGPPSIVDISGICLEASDSVGLPLRVNGPLPVRAHEARIRMAVKMFFEGASGVLVPESRQAEIAGDSSARVTISGHPRSEDFELTKIFKFYYTDPAGNPDLSLATARLIVETYGGEVNAEEEGGNVTLSMSVPLGER